MSEQQDSRVEGILASISTVLDDLTALEQSYKAMKEQKAAELASHLQRLAETSDTKAVRARMLRELYWHKRLPARMLGKTFGLKEREVRTVAGHLVLELPCGRATCTNGAKLTFKSISEIETFEREMAAPGGRKSIECEGCREHRRRDEEDERARREAEGRREAEERRRRDMELINLPWRWFIETPEWARARNMLIAEAGYACGVCKSGRVSLYVYLAKGSPQYSTELWFNLSSHLHLLCADCIPRCEGCWTNRSTNWLTRNFSTTSGVGRMKPDRSATDHSRPTS